jgi:hypothetical protein
MLKQAISIFLLCIIPCFASAEAYRWVDEQGVTHFSDQAKPGAEKIALPETQTYTAPKTESVPNYPPVKEKITQYAVSVLYPEEGENYPPGHSQQISVAVEVTPGLEENHLLQFYLDGELIYTGRATTYTIPRLDRGQHAIMAQVVEPRANNSRSMRVLAKSELITFYTQQASILNPSGPGVPKLPVVPKSP